jgi:hypothetical protein
MVNLTAAEILILKELKGAGGRGRDFDQRSSELERLVWASYVSRHPNEGTATRYVITDKGRIALYNTVNSRNVY